ncbi:MULTISPECIES: peptidase domain-containing ABC transporter [unclassified Synechococcus]|uniref:peptidase domain-containing ABC transporter n=1 Tax=unclassified Synechococcus TaxID=2626047 RepID=UPI0021A85017|nr:MULTISPECIES: peptidase domain-containing ABC transporter [unclassified Synechococcus]MCT0212850.1 peptidase domain-containing ABC transporter [Synechococcus sp. CS-1326]MCT0233054.1 peptidase domain-containing ABC transporter [Synechococcus sp. CS-1327]
MTTLLPPGSLLDLAPFRDLPAADQQRLAEAQTLVDYPVGASISRADVLADRVVVLLEGQARLLAETNGLPFTLERLGPGSIIGLASLLRAAACEEVSAASAVRAVTLPDRLILELHASSAAFRSWCAAQLWPAELQALLTVLHVDSARCFDSDQQRQSLIQASAQARLLAAGPGVWATLGEEEVLVVASANLGGAEIGTVLRRGDPLPVVRPPLPARLIALPAALLAVVAAPFSGPEAGPGEEHPAGPPLASDLDLGQSDPARQLRLIRASGPLDETLACFQMLATLLELPFRRDAIESSLRSALRRQPAPDLPLCGQLAATLGLHVSGAKVPARAATRLLTPCLLPWNGGFAIATASNAAGLRLASPRDGWVQLSPPELEEHFPEGIELLMLERSSSSPEQRFGPGWFWPALQRYRGMLLQVLLASFVVQLFSLANPLLIQVIIDKVISQRSLDTLQVLGFALVVVTLMEGLIGSMRTFLFTDTTNRIDLRLGAEVIDHLLRLPLGYFDRRPVGELGTRIAELEKIRNFLTGQALLTVLDAVFSVIYILVMLLYSWLLTLIALAVLPIQIALTLLGSPLIRRQIRSTAEENARTQSHLVEVLTGIQTVKAQNVEMVSRWKWQEYYSKYIARSFEKAITGTALNETSQVLQKLSQLMVLWVGASLVLKGELTLGQLIAFRIISGFVTQPLLRLSSIWQNIQELRVSFERLADVVDTPEESNQADQAKIPLPPLVGLVDFQAVSFRFSPATPEVLKNINLTIQPGTFVGIVGQSGSGKSTLMKLLPRLYSPSSGQILIDQYDIDKVELYSLRRQIGIVPQEPLLFSGSISTNIALTNPEATSEAIVSAARAAEAHDFIMALPDGYSSMLGERGASLSGGQRQRLAIARTLLGNPKLLVMDEATSALDYDTERRVCDNLRERMAGCTTFFITHRLNTIRRADLIVVMHQGAIVETGSHAELISLQGRYYAQSRQQESA